MESNKETAAALDMVDGITVVIPMSEIDLRRGLGRLLCVGELPIEIYVDGKRYNFWDVIKERFAADRVRTVVVNTTLLESAK